MQHLIQLPEIHDDVPFQTKSFNLSWFHSFFHSFFNETNVYIVYIYYYLTILLFLHAKNNNATFPNQS